MKLESNRALLLGVVNEKVEGLLSLITVTKETLALSDEQIKRIDDCLLVRSLQEFEDKWGINFRNIKTYHEKEVEPKSRSDVFYDSLICNENREAYQIWYYQNKEKQNDKQLNESADVKLYEIWLGVKCFFEQGDNLELLVTNNSYEDWETKQAEEKLTLYINTVNDKLDNSHKLAVAILPEIPITTKHEENERKRFPGNTISKITNEALYRTLSKVLQILFYGKIIACYQFVTNERTSFKIMAQDGRDAIIKAAHLFQGKVNIDEIVCCYPNLTWIAEHVYIGAAYIVAGMILAGKGEKDVTTLPREIYPYSTEAREILEGEPYGAMLAYNPQNTEKYMLLWWLRSHT